MKQTKARYQQGSISKIPGANGYSWRVRFSEWVSGKRVQRSLTLDGVKYPTKSDVKRAIEFEVIQQNKDTERAKVDALFGVITTLYKEEHLPGLQPSTQQTNMYLLRDYIDPKFQHAPIRDLTPQVVGKWLKELSLAPTTKSAIRSVLSKCLNLAAENGYIPAMERNPMSLVRLKGVTKRQKRIQEVSIADFKRLVAALPEPLNLMALVTGSLGLRISETLALKWSDVDDKAGTIMIRRKFTHGELGETKTAASEAPLPLATSLLKILLAYKPKTGDSEWVFPSSRNGGPRSASVLLQKGLKPVVEKLGLGRVTWHTLRHACRSWLSSGGAAMGTQKDLLRHSDISTTMNVYGHALTPDMRLAHEDLVSKIVS